MSMPCLSTRNRDHGTPARRAAALLSVAVLAALAGCDINKPEMPTFDTSLTLPLGVERLDVADALDSEDFLATGSDGSLLFQVDGTADTLSFNFDLTADVPARTLNQGLGSFAIASFGPLSYGFLLSDVWAPAAAADGLTAPVPAFPVAVTSADQDVAQVQAATLASGTASVTVTNGLPVAISAAGGPDQLVLVMESPAGVAFASFTFGPIAAGASQTRTVDLAGAVLPDRLRVRLAGGSAGSGGQAVTIDAGAALNVSAAFTDLLVSSATAVVGAQSFDATFASPLPSGYEVTAAALAGGSAQLSVTNGMPVPCRAVLTWPNLRNAGGTPLSAQFDLGASASAARTIDFAGYTLSDGGAPLTSLDATVSVTSPGSAGVAVAMDAGDGLSATLGAATISFASVTGVIPEAVVVLDPTVEQIDLPEELDGLSLTAATLTLSLDTMASLPGNVDLTLRGVAANGTVRDLNISQPLNQDGGKAVTEIVLDQTNSGIVDFLNNLPERITLLGQVALGGNGAVGTVRPNDKAVVTWSIVAPVEVVIDGASLDSDPRLLDVDADLQENISTHAQGASAQLEVLNHLPVALSLTVLVGQDANTLDSAPLLAIGPLDIDAAQVDPVTHTVSQAIVSRPTFTLTAAQAQIFGQPGLVTKVVATLPSSNGQAARVLSTDYLEVRGVVQLDVLVDDKF